MLWLWQASPGRRVQSALAFARAARALIERSAMLVSTYKNNSPGIRCFVP